MVSSTWFRMFEVLSFPSMPHCFCGAGYIVFNALCACGRQPCEAGYGAEKGVRGTRPSGACVYLVPDLPGWLNTRTVRSQCADQAHYTRVRVARRATTLAQNRNRQRRRVVHRVAKGMHVPTLPFRCSHVTRDARGQRELCALTH